MKKITSNELREMYLKFYEDHGHKRIDGASIIPKDDPTVLFTTAGMQPLVPYLLGKKHPMGNRLTDVQRCIRTVDIEEVGDAGHLTCFEMLGCWSLGDYWKDDIIQMTYEFFTSEKYLGIPKERLYATVFAGDEEIEKDEESYRAWLNCGLDENHIVPLPRKNNFWQLGSGVGPCGPDSEIYYDTGAEPCSDKCYPGCDCNKYLELGNNVFLQYNRDRQGKYEKLEQRNIDQGIGLERNLMILNGVDSAYETDLFESLKEKLEKISGMKYELNKESFRVIMEHLRTATFILGDNVKISPSNKDQGYILRRLIRRTVRHLKKLGVQGNVLQEMSKSIIDEYGKWYPELKENESFILESLDKEEKVFNKTIMQGIKEFDKITQNENLTIISGETAFKLFATYGFPLEFTMEMAKEKGISVDEEGFRECYEEHQQISRNGAKQKFKGGLVDASTETVRLHTAVHLLNATLRHMFGDSILQKGSNITPERLRFDFSFDRKLTDKEKNQ